MRYSPRRRQPAGWSWLAPAAATSLVLWMGLSSLLSFYLTRSGSFGAVYGQLTSIMALLVWAQLTSLAIFWGFAVTAQVEAARAGVRDAALEDYEAPGAGTSGPLEAGERLAGAAARRVWATARRLLRRARGCP
jgi:uncharacterized BrkB/YihY/UPF0761 family membrane protein